MTRASIDYLNARRAAKPASGGKVYRKDTNAVDLRDQWNALDTIDQAALQIDHVFSDFRKWCNNLQPVEAIMRGETCDDLSF